MCEDESNVYRVGEEWTKNCGLTSCTCTERGPECGRKGCPLIRCPDHLIPGNVDACGCHRSCVGKSTCRTIQRHFFFIVNQTAMNKSIGMKGVRSGLLSGEVECVRSKNTLSRALLLTDRAENYNKSKLTVWLPFLQIFPQLHHLLLQ